MNNRKSKVDFNIIVGVLIAVFVFAGIAIYPSNNNSDPNVINQLISLDDTNYQIEMDSEEKPTVRLPEGRPRVPHISCERAEVFQAFFPDGYKEAVAKIYLEDKLFKIKFVKDSKLGFELQYDDRYKFIPKTIVAKEFYSSDKDVAVVDSFGNIKITGISNKGVTITATDGANKEELVITKTIRAPLDIYMITGQSNASYYYAEPQLAPITKIGTAYHYSELIGGEEICSMNNEDGSMNRGNIEASFCKTLYDLTGEKILMVNAGVSGRKINTFVPKDGESFKHIEYVWEIISKHIEDEDFLKHYETRIRSYIWAQGESDQYTDIEKYKDNYLSLHKVLRGEEYGFQYAFIILTKPKFENSYIAQEQLANENRDITIATRAVERFTVENGNMRFDDLHYSQLGDNLLGEETAKSIFKAYTEGIESVAGNY